MPLRPLDSWREVGRRVAAARTALDLTQGDLAREINLERTALAKIEAGSRGLNSLELARLAAALGRPIESFVAESLPAVVSRRAEALESTRRLDLAVQDFARDVQLLLDLDVLKPVDVTPSGVPRSVRQAEELAANIRVCLGVTGGPLFPLDSALEVLGLYVAVLDLGPDAGDGAYIALEGAGAAVINGASHSGRRRFNLAHEVGHHVMADEYVTDWHIDRTRDETEKRVNAFAIHLLMPREATVSAWEELRGEDSPREAAIQLAQDFCVSWTAACSQLQNLGLIESSVGEQLRHLPPTRAEHLALGGIATEDLVPPRLSPRYAEAVLRAYRSSKISSGRATELLHGAAAEDDLPPVNEVPLAALRDELG